jgi:rubredoxin
MQTQCPNCGKAIPIPDQYIGRVKCRYCAHIFKTEGQLHDQRKYILKRLVDLEASGFQYVRWLSANDEHVCPLCAEKNKNLFKPNEIKELINGKFCQAKDFWQGCRCVIVADRNPAEVLKSKSNSPIKVVSNVKTEIRDGEPTMIIQFDLKVNKRQLAKLKKKREKGQNE